jgi:hypothetical protein
VPNKTPLAAALYQFTVPLEQVAESVTLFPEQMLVVLLGETLEGGGIITFVVAVVELNVAKFEAILAVLVIAQLVGVLLMVALNVIVVLLPAGIVKPEPAPLTVTVSPDSVLATEF